MRLWWKLQQWWWDVQEQRRDLQWGCHLSKASYDPFTYSIGMRDGSVFHCQSVKVRGSWVELEDDVWMMPNGTWDGFDGGGNAIKFDRGAQVRLADIVWCADCPEGS